VSVTLPDISNYVGRVTYVRDGETVTHTGYVLPDGTMVYPDEPEGLQVYPPIPPESF
jgi:hypothetical protein